MSEWRRALPADAEALADLERDANLVALAHVFPPAEHPFPRDAVLARWRHVLGEDVVVEVVDGPARLDAYVAHDGRTLRHLAVHPDAWGRGLGAEAVERAAAAGADRLWCLAANHRARRLYDRLGWRPTGVEREAEWPPHPVELEYIECTADEPTTPVATSEG